MEKFKVSFTADNQQLKAIGTKHASDTYADIEAEFVLGNRWTDMDSVSAVWWNDFTRIATVLDPQGKCVVPHEVLTRKGCVRVNLVGSVMEGDELKTRLTSYSAEAVQVNEKIKLTGSETSEITPSQFEQFVAMVISEVEKVTGMTATAETLPAGSDATARYENGVLHLGIPQGIQGETGNGIESVVFDNYTLRFTFTDGTVFTTPSLRGAEGNGIRSIAKTGTSGLVDTYTITFDDGSTTTYTVTNGAKGEKGETGATPSFSIGTVETLEPTEDATATITGTAENPILNLGIPQGKTGEVTYEDLESILPRDTASGQIASFPDGQSVIPLHSLKVSLEPIQDLNGYDKPWAGGAGKNLFNYEDVNSLSNIANSNGTFTSTATDTRTAFAFTIQQYNENTYVKSNNLNISASGRYYVPITIDSTVTKLRIKHNGASKEFRFDYPFTKEGAFCVSLEVTSADPTVVGGVSFKDVMIESGSTMTAYEPYTNICPISGRTECVTSVSGKNLFPNELPSDAISATLGTSAITSASNARVFAIPCKPNTDYTFSHPTMGTYAITIGFGTEPPTIGASVYGRKILTNISAYTANSGNNTYLYINPSRVSEYESAVADGFQIEVGLTATDYVPYTAPTTYTTTLGRTVYGGTLDVVSGELVVDRAMVTYDGTENWSSNGANLGFIRTEDDMRIGNAQSGYCNRFATISNNGSFGVRFGGNNTVIYFNHITDNISDVTDLASWKTWLANNPTQIVYPLATPQTIQLTPQEVRTLLGTNNVWSDGTVTVVYSADTALWIEKKLNS